MRELNIGNKHFTKIMISDELGQDGTCHEYYISRAQAITDPPPEGEFGHVFFQNGPVKEFGINGCDLEDLLAIVIDRLRGFQAGSFVCLENALALTKIEEAMHWLNHRSADRQSQGVEGTSSHRK